MLRLSAMLLCGLAPAAPAPEPPAGAKPVRVLLFASAATREYQFVRNLVGREADKKHFQLAVYLQLPPGRTEAREGVEQDATLLKKFPGELTSYDVIVAFDPDWAQFGDDQQKQLKQWVEGGGGLIVVAGPVNTNQLARKPAADQFKPVVDLYPVVVGDSRLNAASAEPDKAFALHFPAADKTTPAFLKLDADGKGPLAGWDSFFFGSKEEHKETDLERGFYGVYPVESLKPAATVLATFADPKAKLADGQEAPFLATATAGKGRVVYLGSGEMWRLRQFREAFHDAFWTGLVRYAAP